MKKRQVFGVFRTAHAWAGAVLSLQLALLGLSGALLVFKEDFVRTVEPVAREAFIADPQALAAIAVKAEEVFGADDVRSIRFAEPGFALSYVRLHSGDAAYLDARGEVVSRWQGHNRPEEWLLDLHEHLLAGRTGEIFVGLAGLCGLVLVFTGLVAIWPARRAIGLTVVPISTARRDLLASHRNLGLMAAAPLLLIFVTGAGMTFDPQARAVLAGLTGQPPAKLPKVSVGEGRIDWHAVMGEAQARYPDGHVRLAVWPRDGRAGASVRLKQPAEWQPNGRTTLTIDPATSAIVGDLDGRALPAGDKAFYSFYPLHAAKLGEGLPARLHDAFMALTGLALFLLGLIGVYAFLRKRLKV